MRDPSVFTIILNTNRRDDTLACLASLSECAYGNHRILVLDNHSYDGSADAVRSQFPGVEVIELCENLGYAGNNNVGIRAALDQGADWVFVLNEDTVLARDSIARLVDVGESNPLAGMVGPMVYHYDEPGIIQSAGGYLNHYWEAGHFGKDEEDRGQFGAPRQVEWLTGCGIMVRRRAIERAGMLDSKFFIYWEETEWCIRIRKAGYILIHVPEAKIWHKGVQRDYHPKPSFAYYNTRNRFFALAKHNAPIGAWVAAWEQTLRTLVSWSLKPKWRHMHAHRDAMLQGTLDFLRGRSGVRPI